MLDVLCHEAIDQECVCGLALTVHAEGGTARARAPYCPATVPPARSVDPAISTISWVKLRPFKGKSEIALVSTTLPI